MLVERDGLSYREAAKYLYGDKGSLGIGASMRIAQIGLFYHRADDLDAQARVSATVTHAQPVSIDGAAVQAADDPGSAADAIGRTVSVHESMPFAIYVFLANPKSFVDCLYTAALNGGDRDTLAAMASAVSGAYLGIEALPASWLAKVENRDDMEILALRMAKLVA